MLKNILSINYINNYTQYKIEKFIVDNKVKKR